MERAPKLDRQSTLDEFGLWSKFPYLAFIGILFYLIIFSSTTALVLEIGGESQYIGFFSTDTARWQELGLRTRARLTRCMTL